LRPSINMDLPRPVSPPIPDSGLPIGWSIDQWNHFGHEYLETKAPKNDRAKCWACLEIISTNNYHICPQCGAHYHLPNVDGCLVSILEKCRNCSQHVHLFHLIAAAPISDALNQSNTNLPTIEQPETVDIVASELGISNDELRNRALLFDLNQDGVIQRDELEIAGQSIINSEPTVPPLENHVNQQQPVLQPAVGQLIPNQQITTGQYHSQGTLDEPHMYHHTSHHHIPLTGVKGRRKRNSLGSKIAYGSLLFALMASVILIIYIISDLPLPTEDGWASNPFTGDSDSDGDGVLDTEDDCEGFDDNIDVDSDGVPDDCDPLIDSDGDGIKDSEDIFPNNPSEWADFDADGTGDNADLDDDNDGVLDSEDVFPYNPSEWADFDKDGTGDNADLDDDNDGVLDSVDMNDYADTGILLTLETFTPLIDMDYFDYETELYICVYIEDIAQGCAPGANLYWLMTTDVTYDIDYAFFADLDETIRYHEIMISAWDSDAFEDDRIDINPDSNWNSYIFAYDSVLETINKSTNASGEGDGTGWDGEMSFTFEPVDLREQRFQEFIWDYDGEDFSITLDLEYDTYSYFKNLNHDVGGVYDVDSYGRFSTPNENYVVELANDLENMAVSEGYTTQLEKAEFVYAFVGDIQYQLDTDAMGEDDYPKYPIEMLWQASGDCEDAAILYISLIEAMGYDAMFVAGLVKQSDDEDWGGHAWAVVHIPNHNGDGWYGPGSKSDIPFYFVEATAHHDGVSEIGRNPWYDLKDESFYDVE